MQNYGYTAYPYGQTYGYSPYGQRFAPQQQQMTQPMQAQAQPQMQPQAQSQMQQPIPQIQDVRYGTEEEAKAFIVFPNASAYFIDEPKGRLYVKTANNVGASSMNYFAITPINADGTPIKPQEPAPQINYDEFVKVEQLKNFGFVTIEQHNAVLQKLDSLQKKLEGVKPNGTAAKPETRV